MEIFVGFGNEVAQLLAGGFGRIGVFGRNILHTLGIAFEITGLHAKHVNDALEVFVHADRDGNSAQATAETRMERSHDNVEVRIFAIECG